MQYKVMGHFFACITWGLGVNSLSYQGAVGKVRTIRIQIGENNWDLEMQEKLEKELNYIFWVSCR